MCSVIPEMFRQPCCSNLIYPHSDGCCFVYKANTKLPRHRTNPEFQHQLFNSASSNSESECLILKVLLKDTLPRPKPCLLPHTGTCSSPPVVYLLFPAGTSSIDWCEWSWKDHPLTLCRLDQRAHRVPDQGIALIDV